MFQVRFHGRGGQGVAHGFEELGLDEFVKDFRRDRLLVVPASALALTHMGRPLPGAARHEAAWRQMPAHDMEVEEALEEGVTMRWLSTVKHADEGKLLIEKMHLDETGFPQPGCGLCAAECPCGAIEMEPEQT